MNQSYFQKLQPGDLLVFYVTNPVQGFVGFGTLTEKYVDKNSLYWPDEKESGAVIYPLRFRMTVETVLPHELWLSAKIPRTIVPHTFRGFMPLKSEHAAKVTAELDKAWRTPRVKTRPTVVPTGPTGTELEETPGPLRPLHDDLKAMLVEIGNFQSYITEVEYQIPLPDQKMRLDVVWKREMEGVPTFAFEVELSGNVERAGVRLKHAFDRWNSRPFLIVGEDDTAKARNMYGSHDSFGKILRLAHPKSIERLHKAKSDLRKLEQELGLIA